MLSWKTTRATVTRAGLGVLLVFLATATGEAGILDASWTAPTTNTDGSPLTDLASYRVYYGTASSPCPGAAFVSVTAPSSSPGPNQTVSVRLTGLTTGTRYFVSVSAVDTTGSQSSCSGARDAVARGEFAVSPTGTVNFGSVNIGSSVDRTFTVSNTGGGTLSGAASVAAPFSIVSGSPFTLSGAGTTRTVTVRFTPVSTATASATVAFTANGGSITAIVTGTGSGGGSGTDLTRPTVGITSPTSGGTHSTRTSSVMLSGTAADNAGVTRVTWANSRGGSGTAAGTTSWSAAGIPLQPGSNVLTVTASDAAGNTGTAALTVVCDPTPPSVGITAPDGGSTVSGTTTVTATAADNIGVAGVQFLLDGVALGAERTAAPFSLSWTTTSTANGSHVLSARARDAAGNTTLATSVPITVSNGGSTPPPPPPAPGPQPSGLVAAYSFNQSSGSTVADSSGNNNTGTLGSGVTRTSQGRFGGALVFDGTGFVTVPAAASLNLTAAVTVEAWVYPTASVSNWSTLIFKEQPGELQYALYASSPTNRPNVFFNSSTSIDTERGVAGPTALAVNTWTHLAGTFDGTTLRLYVNGTLVASQRYNGPMQSATGVLRIGGNGVWGEFFRGRIDEVRVYSRALSQAEIQTDMGSAIGDGVAALSGERRGR